MARRSYNILKDGEQIRSFRPGIYAGNRPYRIFGTLQCNSGKRMKKENRVFFHSLEDAVAQGYRPCKHCKPMDEDDFRKIRHLVEFDSLQEFYDRDKGSI